MKYIPKNLGWMAWNLIVSNKLYRVKPITKNKKFREILTLWLNANMKERIIGKINPIGSSHVAIERTNTVALPVYITKTKTKSWSKKL